MRIEQDFLEERELSQVHSILDTHAWKYGFISNDPNFPIWNFDKTVGKPIAELLLSKVPEYTLLDYHINGQTLNLSSSLHNDSSAGATHALVYFPYSWDYVYGGRLHIFSEQQVSIITPSKNLAVLFDANLMHYAEAPVTKHLRVSVGLKLKLK